MRTATRRLPRIVFALLAVLLALPIGSQAPSPGTEPPPPRPPGFREVIEVNIVNLTVRVTDREGRPVKGLRGEDFEIRENGDPVEITNFYEVASGTDYEQVGRDRAAQARSAVPAEPAPARVPAAEEGEVATLETRQPVRHLAIFVDNANIHPRNRQLVFRGLRDFLHDRTGPADRLMVVSFRNDYEVVQPFTEANADIVKAIDGLERAPSDGANILADRRLVIRDLQSTDLTPFTGRTDGNMPARIRVESDSRVQLQRIEQVARETRQRTLNTLGALRYLAGSMAGLPEPKAILYLSDGLEMRPAQALFQAHWDRFSQASETLGFDIPLETPESLTQEYDLSRQFTSLAADAQASGVSFFAVDASGQTATLGGSAEFGMRDAGSVALSGYAPAWNPRLDQIATVNRQSTLQLLADETGGAVLLNTRNYDSFFGDLRASLDNYYSLGFQAPHAREGRRHKLEVRVRQPGLHVSHQQAYVDKPWEMRLSEQTVSGLVLGVPLGDMTVQANPGKPTPQDNRFVLPVQILVPIDALGLIPDGSSKVANLSLTIVTKDAEGNTKPPQAMELRLRLTEEEAGTAANGEANIRLLIDAVKQDIGIGVRDQTSGKTATTILSIDPTGNSGR